MTPEQMQAAMGSGTNKSSTPNQFTPQSMMQVMNGGITPTQSAAALSHSTSMIGNVLKGGWGALSSVAKGVQKGVESTELGIADLGAKAIGAKGAQNAIEGYKQTPAVQPQNLGEAVGKTGEQIGEFFVPGGAEKAVAAKGAALVDKVGMMGKVANTAKSLIKGATSALSFGGVTAAQTGDMGKAENAAEFGGALGTAGGIIEHFGPGIGEALQKADFRMTPMQEAKASKVADSAASFMQKNGIIGNEYTKFDKLTKINQDLESTLQKSLPEGVAVSKAAVADKINAYVEQLKQTDPAIYNQARSKADEAIGLMGEGKDSGTIMSLKDALGGKRSWGQMAFKTSRKSKIDPTVSSEGAYAIEQAYQKALEEKLEVTGGDIKIPPQLQKMFDGQESVSLPEFNKVYSSAINAKSLTGIAQYRNDAGLFGRLFGLWTGKAIGQTIAPGLIGEIIGAGAGEAAATKLPGFARNTAERALQFPGLPEAGGKIDQAMENQ